jgi:hypothetical protein
MAAPAAYWYSYIMVLLTHIIIAITSIAFSTYTFFRPSQTKLHLSYVLVAAVLGTGFYLVWQNPSSLARVCTTGLLYLGGVTVALVAAHHRLASKNDD